MKQIIPISFHDLLVSKIALFLEEEGMICPQTEEGIPELISKMIDYKEEGKSLYPDIYIFDDLELVRRMVSNSQVCYIGKDVKAKDTMLKALKKCAPLTENGWAIYILRKENEFEYGLFRGGVTLLSVSVAETLVDPLDEQFHDGLKVIFIHQVADKLIELKGVRANTLLVSYGNKANSLYSPLSSQIEFIKSITKNVNPILIDQTTSFFRKVFLEVLRKGHGTLACVVKSKTVLPKRLQDGIILEERINVPQMISDLMDLDNLASNSKLEGQFSIIIGMMQTDGITVFTDKGEIASYNVFIKHPLKFSQSKTTGGARSRTFLALSEYIGIGIEAAYIQSQDGKIEYSNGKE